MAFTRAESERYIQEIRRNRSEQQRFEWGKLIRQIGVILEKVADRGHVTFADFDSLYFTSTGHRYEDKVDEILCHAAVPSDRSIDAIFGDVQMKRHVVNVEYDNVGQPVFILKPKSTPRASLTSSGDTRATVVASSSTSGGGRKIPVSSRVVHLKPTTSRATTTTTTTTTTTSALQNPPIPAPHRSAENFHQMNNWESVFEMFATPYWPGVTAEFRAENLELYKRFLETAVTRPPNDPFVMREAKKLAVRWWKPRLRYFSHIMFLLYRLSVEKPRGFRISDFDREIEQSFPMEWRRIYPDLNGLIDDFHSTEADLALLNLIQPSDVDNPMMYKVNRVISFLGFHRIYEPEVSMVYQFVSMTEQARNVMAIHEWMCETHPTWRDMHNAERGQNLIWEMCVMNYKMFSMESDGMIVAKEHAYKIPLPMIFALSFR